MEFYRSVKNRAPGNGDCFLLWNGLGGYSSLSAAFGAPRADQGLLVAAVRAPNERVTLVHRLSEQLDGVFLSAQSFGAGEAAEDGLEYLEAFSVSGLPRWIYRVGEVTVTRELAMAYGENTVALRYTVENRAAAPCTLTLTPYLKFAPKETALTAEKKLLFRGSCIFCQGHTLHIRTDGALEEALPHWQTLAYPEDAKDGRPEKGLCGSCARVVCTTEPETVKRWELVFSDREGPASAGQIIAGEQARLDRLEADCGLRDPIARQLAVSADAFIARRDSTGGKTILAGYPLFSDWGRDTMIALPGCCLATGRYDDAKSILKTFLAYERNGLVPNLFPEGGQAPMYNTADAALLLIDCVWQYLKCRDDPAFLQEAYPVMENIVRAYRTGTDHHIGMDTDGLIFAGQGTDQVTWMDVCIQGVLPTPRHGKPVELNAYWYNALCIMARLAPRAGAEAASYAALAGQVKDSFTRKFFMPHKGYLKDVLSGTEADEQLRCNQIWALSMDFTMLPEAAERQVLQAVTDHLITDCGLRTLAPQDPQYHGFYGGSQYDRDMAYHQGTVWVFPLGAYYRACLRLTGAGQVRRQLDKLLPMLTRGCVGQLPEIYDGDDPLEGKGCFAQAWSVGELLRIFKELEL